MQRKIEKVQVLDLLFSNAGVFYGLNPDDNPGVMPEYITTTERGGHEWVWVVFFTEKNPYIKPRPPQPEFMPRCLGGLINSLESDWF